MPLQNKSDIEVKKIQQEQINSGLSVQKFCKQKGIPYSTFQYWKYRRGKPKKIVPQFLTVSVPEKVAPANFEIQIGNDLSIFLPTNTPLENLAKLIKLIHD